VVASNKEAFSKGERKSRAETSRRASRPAGSACRAGQPQSVTTGVQASCNAACLSGKGRQVGHLQNLSVFMAARMSSRSSAVLPLIFLL
jgi:hypothetical protein